MTNTVTDTKKTNKIESKLEAFFIGPSNDGPFFFFFLWKSERNLPPYFDHLPFILIHNPNPLLYLYHNKSKQVWIFLKGNR